MLLKKKIKQHNNKNLDIYFTYSLFLEFFVIISVFFTKLVKNGSLEASWNTSPSWNPGTLEPWHLGTLEP